ncbi:MAG: tripartite tricarboxylate transporter substrate binding protein [Deltaproteobacteria bacterium]|nr:tripartite tricarboxylate transporter substrate binding protein [Deltaproteobacteria bacterium]
MARWIPSLLASLALVAGSTSSPAAEAFPTKPIEITIGYAPGAGTDLGARMIAEQAKKHLGQDIVCVNKPGGAGRVALTLLSKQKGDGYSLGATTDSSLIVVPHLEKVSYKPLEDFTFIAQYGTLNFGVTVPVSSPFKSLKEVIDWARANPGQLTMGIIGVGSSDHVAFQALARHENIKIKFVPFNGAAPTMTALLGGHVMIAAPASSGFAPHVKAKSARLLAVLSDERLEQYPDVPTFKELGYSDFVFQSWYVISGPKNMDKEVVRKLADAFKRAMATPEYAKLANDLEITAKRPLFGNELRDGIAARDKKNVELFKVLELTQVQ